MPAKSRRKRGKNLPPSKRVKHSGGKISATTTSQTPEKILDPNVAAETPVMSEKNSTPPMQSAPVRYPYISSELRTIGILAVLVLVILGILAVTL
ncbi:MAG: hypothetical protein JSU79_02630 [Dehalococcoidales bacterium]|nr:MAG: hypothetical protein JSU79_02630 [Dehalococcoidales bacterium]